jgi:uncharacterized membrane protein SirB2
MHMTSAALTFTLFVLRGSWMIRNSPLFRRRWTKVVPPVIDTVLLLTGFYLVMQTQQYPLKDSWLTAKLTGVLVYIGFGIAAFRGKTRRQRILFWLLACSVFIYILLVALTRNPVPFDL